MWESESEGSETERTLGREVSQMVLSYKQHWSTLVKATGGQFE
jgi:hypothetical protein